MAPRLDYGMIYGVGIWPLRKPFRVYLVLHVQRWNFMEVPFSGT